ncbi:MAG: DUF3341 domain-containing protein [Acidobacteriota bacterium]
MATKTPDKPPFYGAMAEFLTPQQLLDAVQATHRAGYTKLDAYMPYPVEAISHEIAHHKPSAVSKIVFVGGLSGAVGMFLFQCWAMGAFQPLQDLTIDLFRASGYPFNIGGRPLFSWPAFIPPAFELTILFGAFSAVVGMFALNGLPQPYHPVFNVEAFERASDDRFFLAIESDDPTYDHDAVRGFLQGLEPVEVHDVEW